jgi:glycerol kinase
MDSMPIGVPSFSGETLKSHDLALESNHVENITVPVVEHQEHLPSGVSETEQEKKGRWFIGSIDCGTTSSRFLIFDGEGNPVASHQIEFENIYPESG